MEKQATIFYRCGKACLRMPQFSQFVEGLIDSVMGLLELKMA